MQALLLGAVVAVPSVAPEAFCRAVVEALALGRPVVAAEGGGISEIHAALRAAGGERFARRLRLVPPGDPAALHAALEEALRAESPAGGGWPGGEPSGPARQVADFVRARWDVGRMCERELEAYRGLLR